MLALILSTIEKILNKLLETDKSTQDKLVGLSGKVLMLEITTISLTVFIKIEAGCFKLSKQSDEKPTTKVSGDLSEFIKLFSQMDKDLPDSHLHIEGNVHLLQTFRALLIAWDIDWEEHLSHYVGDIISHQVVNFFRRALRWEHKTRQAMINNLSEYLHTERQCFPHQEELIEFYQKVDVLRNDVDRITQRVNRLKANLQVDI